jgi:hypothetical protein
MMATKTISSMMVHNAVNIVVNRMQNVDYPHRKSFLKTLKDLVVVDKHRMFYKGLLPVTIAVTNLHIINSFMIASGSLWPFVFGAGTLLVHPFMLLGLRV